MASLRFALLRFFGSFWVSRRGGVFARFAESRAYVPTVMVVAWASVAVVVAGALSVIDTATAARVTFSALVPALIGLVVTILACGALLLLLVSFGSVVEHAAAHAGVDDAARRCEEMLKGHGFRVTRTASGLLARRGSRVGAESEWREYPIEASVRVSASGGGASLAVRCVSGAGMRRLTRDLLDRTCRAIAGMDDDALSGLDRTPVVRSGVLRGGLAGSIASALMVCALATTAIVGGLGYLASAWISNYMLAESLREQTLRVHLQLLSDLDWPLRMEVTRLGAASKRAAEERLKGLKVDRYAGELVVAVSGGDGAVGIVRPDVKSALHGQVGELLRAPPDPLKVLRPLRDRVFRRLPTAYTRQLAEALGVKTHQLTLGVLLTHEDIRRLAPTLGYYIGSELTYFEAGRPFLRLSWGDTPGAPPRVDGGADGIPADVIEEMRDAREASFLRDITVGGGAAGIVVRSALRDGRQYRITYRVDERDGPGTGWSGFAFAEPYAPDFDDLRMHFLGAAAGPALFALLALLGIVFLIAVPAAGRIARPVLQVRDALRAIADGDYAVRVPSARKDEIGQLQKLVNHTAEELRKRESIRELMGKYLSKQVADRILEAGNTESLVGTRREVSILFADVRGFTAYSERHDPEQVTRTLNEYFEVMVDVIAAHEGVLDKYIGDGLMVVFGAPVSQPDHARRAVLTALEMQAALQSLNLRRMQRGDEPIDIGIGVNTGLAISGNLGSIKRMEFTVVGDTVNLAARLESRAAKGQILIGAATYERVKEIAECQPLGRISVKGKAEEVEVWVVGGLKPAAGKEGA